MLVINSRYAVARQGLLCCIKSKLKTNSIAPISRKFIIMVLLPSSLLFYSTLNVRIV